jgi:hypothetical protein
MIFDALQRTVADAALLDSPSEASNHHGVAVTFNLP